MGFDDVRAQGPAVQTLRRAVTRGRVAQAYLFDGPGGVGKERAALALGAALLCTERPGLGCGRCDVCRRIAACNHPDVRVFRPRDEGNRNIPVDFVRREILPVAQFAPFESSAAVLVFPEADVSFPIQHAESANALLKTLEEPRRGVHFVLCAERPDRLLPTVRSRCQRVTFGRLPPIALAAILEQHGIAEANRELAIALADGRADRALALAQSGAADALLDVALRLDAAAEAAKPGGLLAAAEDIARSDQLALTLETLATFYRDVTLASLGLPDDALAFKHASSHIRQRAATLSPERASARVELIRLTLELLDYNANAEIALDALLLELKEASWATKTQLPQTLLAQTVRS